MIPWYKQKTTWTAVVAVVAAVGALVGGEITLISFIPMVLAAVGGIFMRQGIEKLKPDND